MKDGFDVAWIIICLIVVICGFAWSGWAISEFILMIDYFERG